MSRNIFILDSTLRDGGYCNNWEFGAENKKKIVSGLIESNVDIIECGMLSQGIFSENQSKYLNLYAISEFLPKEQLKKKMYVVLMNYGDYDVSDLPESNKTEIDGIRVAFHKKDVKEAVKVMKKIKEKNYKVFMQPMVTVTYSTEEYVNLIEYANELKPYSFYIVDSFGSMKSDELKKYCDLASYLLSEDIILGLHTHNNLQLAFSNAQLFEKETAMRSSIIDCCIMGMGRGAGNLNTELFLNYLNMSCSKSYNIEPILTIIDEIINIFYQRKYWGYSLPNYLSASHNIHPNYGTFLADKNTLTISMINELFSLISVEKKNTFDKKYIEELYVSYMSANNLKNKVGDSLKEIFEDKEVLIIAPGKSVDTEIDRIQSFVKEKNVMVVCINFDFKMVKTDYIFISNPKRYEELDATNRTNIIVTSNVVTEQKHIVVDYLELLCNEEYVRDNSAMMLIKLLINSGASKIYLAGVDGYGEEIRENYTKYSNTLVTSSEYMNHMNNGMNAAIHKYMSEINIQFVTTEKRIKR